MSHLSPPVGSTGLIEPRRVARRRRRPRAARGRCEPDQDRRRQRRRGRRAARGDARADIVIGGNLVADLRPLVDAPALLAGCRRRRCRRRHEPAGAGRLRRRAAGLTSGGEATRRLGGRRGGSRGRSRPGQRTASAVGSTASARRRGRRARTSATVASAAPSAAPIAFESQSFVSHERPRTGSSASHGLDARRREDAAQQRQRPTGRDGREQHGRDEQQDVGERFSTRPNVGST